MEEFFTPTRRYQVTWEQEREDPFECDEVKLSVPVEEFLNYRWDWKDLRAFLTGGATPKILWISKKTFLVLDDPENEFDFHGDIPSCVAAEIQASGSQEQALILAHLDHSDMSTGEVSVFWRAVATNTGVKLKINNQRNNLLTLQTGPILSRFLRESPAFQEIHLWGIYLKEEDCRALATLERTDLKVKLGYCTIEPNNAEDTFIEWFRNNQIVTEIDNCSPITSALRGNTSVKKLVIERNNSNFGEEEILSLCQALPGNMGIEHLAISGLEMSDEACRLFFRSLTMHPRINFLSIQSYSVEAKRTMMKAIIKMLHLNTRFHTIKTPDAYTDEEMYQNSILPRLEMNRTSFEVQRQAVKRADPSIRPQLLGRALHAVRYNPELVFLFLSENVPAFVWTEEEEVGYAMIPLQNDLSIVSGQKRKASS
jgi:hypothetical protein